MTSIADQIKLLAQDVRAANQGSYEQVVAVVTETANALSAELGVPGLSFVLEIGHRVNLGQQYKFVVSVDSSRFKDTFFRFYVPFDGFPTTLQLFEGESKECNSVDEVRNAVLEFLGRPPIKQRLRTLITMATTG